MSDYDNTNKFKLSRNTKRREGKNDSEFTGSGNLDGVEFWLNGWIKEGPYGKFFSGSVRRKDAAPSNGGGSLPSNDLDDDVPF